MAKRTRAPENTAQRPLPGTSVRRKVGPVERSITDTLKAAREREQITPSDDTAVAALRSAARLVDWCERNGEPHTQTLALKQLSELLTKLRLEPSAREASKGVTDDGWDRAALELGEAT